MSYSILSLPFRLIYLTHAWFFTFDVLLLSRRRARTPLALGTLLIFFGTLVYLYSKCGRAVEVPSVPNSVVNPSPVPCVEQDWFMSQLSLLSKRIDGLHDEVKKCDCNSLDLTSEDRVQQAIYEALKIYDADKTGLADYALESAGGSVLSTRCSETYTENMGRFYTFGFIPLFWRRPSPRLAIQPTLAVGECWPFKGTIGYLVLQLSRRIHVESFTLEHIPASLSLGGNIDSAPKDFQVYGLASAEDTTGTLLGNFTYRLDGEPLQHFEIAEKSNETFEHVELKILSNHGNIHYTCLYRFRVHGKPVKDAEW